MLKAAHESKHRFYLYIEGYRQKIARQFSNATSLKPNHALIHYIVRKSYAD
jgi:hypothetical protein